MNHDNYFHPVGFSRSRVIILWQKRSIEQVGPTCWLDESKCQASAAHREKIKTKFPWTWDERNERSKDPENCGHCHYYMRSQLWAHLIYQDQFLSLYPQASFHTGVEGASLNKITIFQLRQYILEAGFSIERLDRTFVKNTPRN